MDVRTTAFKTMGWIAFTPIEAVPPAPTKTPSYTRNPDITGMFQEHGDNFPRLFLPGLKVDSTALKK